MDECNTAPSPSGGFGSRTEALARAFFPKRPHDADYFLYLLQCETARKAVSGGKTDRSLIFDAVNASMKKRRGRGVVTGLVAHAYVFLDREKVRPSLERAALIAKEAVLFNGSAGVRNPNGEGVIETFKINGDLANIKAIFRENRPFAAIWAAETSRSDNDIHISDQSLYLHTVREFECLLDTATDTKEWNLCRADVKKGGPAGWDNDTFKGVSPYESIADAFDICRERGDF